MGGEKAEEKGEKRGRKREKEKEGEKKRGKVPSLFQDWNLMNFADVFKRT